MSIRNFLFINKYVRFVINKLILNVVNQNSEKSLIFYNFECHKPHFDIKSVVTYIFIIVSSFWADSKFFSSTFLNNLRYLYFKKICWLLPLVKKIIILFGNQQNVNFCRFFRHSIVYLNAVWDTLFISGYLNFENCFQICRCQIPKQSRVVV